jgi:hypothetical protein
MRHIKTTGTITALNTYPVSLWDKPINKSGIQYSCLGRF